MISPFCRNDTVEIVVPNGKYRQCVAVEKLKKLCERCQRITPLDQPRRRKARRLCSAKFVLIEINVGTLNTPIIYCCGGPWAGTKAMATAADYRKWAEECFEWAHQARDTRVREQYASLGQVWLECAARAELRPGVITPSEPTTAVKVA
jgi:hypothetical protein